MKGKNTTKPIRKSLKKWYANTEKETGLMYSIFDPHTTSKIRTHVTRLVCHICGVKYVQNLEGNPDAERICDEICQKIYELRMELANSEQR